MYETKCATKCVVKNERRRERDRMSEIFRDEIIITTLAQQNELTFGCSFAAGAPMIDCIVLCYIVYLYFSSYVIVRYFTLLTIFCLFSFSFSSLLYLCLGGVCVKSNF